MMLWRFGWYRRLWMRFRGKRRLTPYDRLTPEQIQRLRDELYREARIVEVDDYNGDLYCEHCPVTGHCCICGQSHHIQATDLL